jgi:hypothetical protein
MSKFQIELLSKNGASVIGVANDAESALNVMDEAMRQYLSRYTHRVAISNRRLIAADAKAVTFKVEDYRIDGPGRYKTMTLDAHEFIRRFLIHVLPKGFHRIRH